MTNVQRWSALGVGLCATLVLVSGCKDGGGIGGIGAPANPTSSGATQSQGGSSSGGFDCQVATVSTCLMPKPDNVTKPSGQWGTDGAISRSDYIDLFAEGDDEKTRENSKLTAADFVSAGYEHWQNAHGTQAEIALTSFGSTSGATQWIDYTNELFGNTDDYQKQSSSVPGTYIFQATSANDDGTWTSLAIGRFGKAVMEFYIFAKSRTDAVAQNNLASWAAVQAGVLKRAASST